MYLLLKELGFFINSCTQVLQIQDLFFFEVGTKSFNSSGISVFIHQQELGFKTSHLLSFLQKGQSLASKVIYSSFLKIKFFKDFSSLFDGKFFKFSNLLSNLKAGANFSNIFFIKSLSSSGALRADNTIHSLDAS